MTSGLAHDLRRTTSVELSLCDARVPDDFGASRWSAALELTIDADGMLALEIVEVPRP